MKIIVFVGPTIAVSEAARVLEADYRPPVAQGDLYRAACEQPWGIGIVDGYFERVPAVWHKEVLWALSRGVHVFGASSMGALRAAELSAFGMVGVGDIYAAFANGTLMDDDEVTVLHGEPAAYRELSVAMVDIRATLAKAEDESVISRSSRDRLEQLAKRVNYTERSFAGLLALAESDGIAHGQRDALRAWLHEGRVHQKRLDALALLEHMGRIRNEHPEPHQPRFAFEHTDAWEQVLRRERIGSSPAPQAASLDEAIYEELCLQPQLLQEVATAAMARVLALEEAERRGIEVDPPMFRHTVDTFRREQELLDTPSVEQRLEREHMNRTEFVALMTDEAKTRWVHQLYAGQIQRRFLDVLRLMGKYGQLAARAQDKQERLASLTGASLSDTGLAEHDLVRWHFERNCKHPAPQDFDLAAQNAGFADRDVMLRVLAWEYLYSRRMT